MIHCIIQMKWEKCKWDFMNIYGQQCIQQIGDDEFWFLFRKNKEKTKNDVFTHRKGLAATAMHMFKTYHNILVYTNLNYKTTNCWNWSIWNYSYIQVFGWQTTLNNGELYTEIWKLHYNILYHWYIMSPLHLLEDV